MTKSKGIGRGGKRPGSGRRAVSASVEAEGRSPIEGSQKVVEAAVASVGDSVPVSITNAARAHAKTAIDALVSVAKDGSDASRVKAAETLLRWGFVSPQIAKLTETPSPATEEKLGKKASALRDAARPNVGTPLGALMAQRTMN